MPPRYSIPFLCVLAFLAVLAACAPSATDDRLAQAGAARTSAGGVPLGVPLPDLESLPPSAVRPDDAPDLVIIAISGHCGLVCNTRDTWSYLDTASESTGGVAVLDGIERAYAELGFEAIETFTASSFVTAHYSEISNKVEPGYLQAQAYLSEVKREWIDGFVNPTRVVLVGHSHGTVWASLLAMNNLDVTFDAFISLDAICWMWWAKHKQFIYDTFVDGPWSIPFPLDQGDPCGTLQIPGQSRRANINDVVSANVIYGLEVRTSFRLLSFDPNVLADDDVNVRINGTDTNLWGVVAKESHTNLGRYYNQSITWVESMITALGVPDHVDYPMSAFVLPPPPEGFEYRSGEIVPEQL